jgi:hypothetical protein
LTDLVVGSGFASSVRVQIEEILYKYHILDWWHRREFENLFRAIYYCYITAGVLHARSTPHRCAIGTCICGILDMVYLISVHQGVNSRALCCSVEPWIDMR